MPVPNWFSELLDRELSQWVRLSELQVGQLYRHYELLLRWNQRMNLTTVKSGPEMVVRHYCESLFFAAHLPVDKGGLSILDLGSGAGFPGIPVAVLHSGWSVTLVESSQRKAVFLREAGRQIENVSVLATRIEAVSRRADWVVSRAVDPEEIVKTVPRLAHRIGLMLGEGDYSRYKSDSRIAWAEPIRLPWGDRKLCVYGSTWNVGPSF